MRRRVRRNADPRLRELQRIYRSGDHSVAKPLAAAYERSGRLPPSYLWREAWGTPRSEHLRELLERAVFPFPVQVGIETEDHTIYLGDEPHVTQREVSRTTTYDGTNTPILDLDDHDEACVCVAAEVNSYGPHPAQMAIEQNRYHASRDTVLQEAFDNLENDLLEAMEPEDQQEYWQSVDEGWNSISENLQYVFLDCMPTRELAAALVGTRWETEGAVEIESSFLDPSDVDQDDE